MLNGVSWVLGVLLCVVNVAGVVCVCVCVCCSSFKNT